MRTFKAICLVTLLAGGHRFVGAEPPLVLQRIGADSLCVTNGTMRSLADGRLSIDSASSRAVVRKMTAQSAEIRFHYLGPSAGSKPLASGELRRQIVIKLRAQDTCNLLYAMWHIEPDSRIAVSIKQNPDQHTHAECDAHGYRNIKPLMSKNLPPVSAGEVHQFRAVLRGATLTLTADGSVVWEGAVSDQALQFDGPVGLRTDNARFELEFFAGAPESAAGARMQSNFYRCEQAIGD
jgi:hypothetical protein